MTNKNPMSPFRAASAIQVAAAMSLLAFRSSFRGENNLQNTRSMEDANLIKSIALPAAGATANSASIDLNATTAGRAPGVELRVQCPATPSLADTKTITLTVQDSADNSSFAAVAEVPVITIGPASGGAGGAAVDQKFKLPIGVRRYLRVSAAVAASGGDNTAKSATIGLVF